MISNACATMRQDKSFLPLLRPFIIKLYIHPHLFVLARVNRRVTNAPVNQSLNDRHLRLLELLLSITASGVGEVDGVANLNVGGEGDVLDLNAMCSDSV